MGSDFTALFCFVDDFIASFEKEGKATISGNLRRGAKPKLNLSEVVTIIISYHLSSYDCFKNYYIKKVLKDHIRDFDLVSYQQFIKLIPRSITVVAALLKLLLGKCNGTSFVDSTSIAVCKNYRISRHKTFSGLGARGKTTKGWFFGFKLHLIINSAGDLIKVRFTAGNKDDRKALADMTAGLFGKMCGDRGYISKDLCDKLRDQGIKLITRIKKGMRNILMDVDDKVMLLKRALIETIIGKIKFLGKFEHSRHRSIQNAFTHMMSALINYQLQDNKPSIISLLTT